MPEPPQELDALANKVIGAAIEVHRHLGPGFLESVYEEALATELGLRNLDFERQKLIRIVYKAHGVGEHRLDF
jgi:GxxExxY protein